MRNLLAHGVDNPIIPPQRVDMGKILELRKRAGLPRRWIYTTALSTGAPQDEAKLHALSEKVRRWKELVQAHGYEGVYVYGIDEATGERLRSERRAFQAAHDGGGKVFVAVGPGFFPLVGDLLDLPVLMGAPDPETARKVHEAGGRIFCYGNPQVGNEEPLTYRRNFGLTLWKGGYDGAMDYAYQHAFGHIWNDFDSRRFRDTVFAYPTVDGVIDTIQWEGFREGVDDVRYLSTLLDAIEKAKGDSALGDEARAAEEWVRGLDVSGDLDALRRRMTEWIITLGE